MEKVTEGTVGQCLVATSARCEGKKGSPSRARNFLVILRDSSEQNYGEEGKGKGHSYTLEPVPLGKLRAPQTKNQFLLQQVYVQFPLLKCMKEDENPDLPKAWPCLENSIRSLSANK